MVVFLAGCQSTQDIYLAQAKDHATVVDIEHVLGRPTYEHAPNPGQRLWLYRREGSELGGLEGTPFCQDLWLTFDQEGVLRTWQTHRC